MDDSVLLEIVSTLRESVASLEGAVEHLETKIQLGDNDVRQGIEVIKAVVMQLKDDVTEIKKLSISEEGKELIYSNLNELKRDQDTLIRKLANHLDQHERKKGYDNAIANIKDNWVQPVMTAVLIAILLAGLRAIGMA